VIERLRALTQKLLDFFLNPIAKKMLYSKCTGLELQNKYMGVIEVNQMPRRWETSKSTQY